MQAEHYIKDYIVFKDGTARVMGKEHLKAEVVARMHTGGQATIEDVMEHYNLTRAQVHAVLAYYYENQAELDEAYEQVWNDSRVIKSSDLRQKIEARQMSSDLDESE